MNFKGEEVKTLYVSDLDGTLLRSDMRTSDYTNRTVNGLIGRGLLFTYATARGVETAAKVTAGLNARIPLILNNGTFLVDGASRKPLYSCLFTPKERDEIYGAFLSQGLYPLTYAVIGGRNRFSYLKEKCSGAQYEFVLSRLGEKTDRRAREIFSEARALDGDVYYFACIDAEEKLRPVYERLKEQYRCFFARDIYTGEMWLEILPAGASKASAVLKLKQLLGCEKVVCFGDGVNDIPMFEIADECYAVANAEERLKRIATGVIGANDDDGVARWLEEHFASEK